ncbi:hypothetical protein D9758_001008 [Tetrapyrgos nigripes]|uniref:Uncharacterized protein n=1 Tax=Tetrapyrgos nigripes TaxID=182062 RepID=A0A8H5LU03_9AGAR|nr:hypothetical protein D9758_001008 [Tetrapyrgos nigripes]
MAPSILALSGLDTPSVADEDSHPDFHVIASFFIGWVFFYSISCIVSSPAAKSLVHSLFRQRQRQVNDFGTSTVKTGNDVESITSSISPSKRDSRTLLLIMSLAFATGSLANFGSLTSFDSGSGLCDFVIAWGELTFMTARLMALFILLFALRQMGIAHWESIVFVVWLLVGLAFIFFDSAVATGVTRPVGPSDTTDTQRFFCYRKHFLPASLVTSILYILLELIVLGRFWFLLASESFSRHGGWSTLYDLRILRTLSLLLLDGLTIVPSAIVTNTLGEFIPLSIGSIILLAAFNATWDNPPVPRTISAPFDFRTIITPSLPKGAS